jgi:hypothetical protein
MRPKYIMHTYSGIYTPVCIDVDNRGDFRELFILNIAASVALLGPKIKSNMAAASRILKNTALNYLLVSPKFLRERMKI